MVPVTELVNSLPHISFVNLVNLFRILSIFFLLFMNFDKNKSQVIFFVTIYRLSDAISDLFQGLFQQRERLDIAGKSLTYRNLLIFFIYFIIY